MNIWLYLTLGFCVTIWGFVEYFKKYKRRLDIDDLLAIGFAGVVFVAFWPVLLLVLLFAYLAIYLQKRNGLTDEKTNPE